MSQTTVTAGQSLVDVALQELGSVAALFDLADAVGLAITDVLTPGAMLPVPMSEAGRPDVAGYFHNLGQRINTGAEIPPATISGMRDFQPVDFTTTDFL